MRQRRSKLARYMMRAEVVAENSHDEDTQVGAILVSNKTGSVIAEGFNGFARHAPDAVLPSTRPDKYEYMIHSEENLVANCARLGISMDDCFVVITHTPCRKCMRLLWQCGITELVCKQKYRDYHELLLMDDIKIEETTTPEGFVRLVYQPGDVPLSSRSDRVSSGYLS